jgi:hypothetical protein
MTFDIALMSLTPYVLIIARCHERFLRVQTKTRVRTNGISYSQSEIRIRGLIVAPLLLVTLCPEHYEE